LSLCDPFVCPLVFPATLGVPQQAFVAQHVALLSARAYDEASHEHLAAQLHVAHVDRMLGRGDWLGDHHDHVRDVVALAKQAGEDSWMYGLYLARAALEFPEAPNDGMLSTPHGDYAWLGYKALYSLLREAHCTPTALPWPHTLPGATWSCLALLEALHQQGRFPIEETVTVTQELLEWHGAPDLYGGWLHDLPHSQPVVPAPAYHSAVWRLAGRLLDGHPDQQAVATQLQEAVSAQDHLFEVAQGKADQDAMKQAIKKMRETAYHVQGGRNDTLLHYNTMQAWLYHGNAQLAAHEATCMVDAMKSLPVAHQVAPLLVMGSAPALQLARSGLHTAESSAATELLHEWLANAVAALQEQVDTRTPAEELLLGAAWLHRSEAYRLTGEPTMALGAAQEALQISSALPCTTISSLQPLQLHYQALRAAAAVQPEAAHTQVAAQLLELGQWPPAVEETPDPASVGSTFYWGKVWAAGMLAMSFPLLLFLAAVVRPEDERKADRKAILQEMEAAKHGNAAQSP